MGNTDTKIQYRKAVIQLTAMNQSIDSKDSSFWSQFWSDQISTIQDIYTLIPASEIRALREEAPSNLATLCFKVIERLVICVDNSCNTQKEQIEALNCVRLLTRVLPYIFEEPEWRNFFWTPPTKTKEEEEAGNETVIKNSKNAPLAQILLRALVDLLFIPEFTANTPKKGGSNTLFDIHTLDSCEYIWEAGIGYTHSQPPHPQQDYNRVEVLKLILTTFSETMYLPPTTEILPQNKWVDYFTSSDNRHALPLFTSLLNILFSYDPIGFGMPYNYILFNDSREPLVEIVAQILCVTLEQNINLYLDSQKVEHFDYTIDDLSHNSNLFIHYLTRLHRDEDFAFILKGFSRLLNNPLIQTYFPGSAKKISFNQELFILFWKFCDLNKKFLYYVLKSSEVLDILVPILYYLNDSRSDTSRIGLMHIGVFILLLLSGERNFGVRLNKPYLSRINIDVSVFNGTHADLLIIVFHKIITTSHSRLQPLFDCLLTIIVNISPYIKSLSMVTSSKLIHLLEAFCTPWFLLSNSTNHHLVFFILEAFNNIIQYQFDGNPNLIYTIIRKRVIFYNLLNLNIEQASINKVLNKQQQQQQQIKKCNNDNETNSKTKINDKSVETELGSLKTTLAATPSILNMTEKTTPSLTLMDNNSNNITSPIDISTPSVYQTNLNDSLQENVFNDHNHLSISSFSSQDLNNTQNSVKTLKKSMSTSSSVFNTTANSSDWQPGTEWVQNWKNKLPLQTIMRLLQVLVPQVEKICIDKNLTDETEILKFLQHGTLVGLLPVPHPILIRKYQPNHGTAMWFRTYIWGVIYLRNTEPPIWYDSDVKLFEIQRV